MFHSVSAYEGDNEIDLKQSSNDDERYGEKVEEGESFEQGIIKNWEEGMAGSHPSAMRSSQTVIASNFSFCVNCVESTSRG